MKASVYANKQVTDELKRYNDEFKKKLSKHDSDFEEIKTLLKQVIVWNQNSFPDSMDYPKAQDPTTLVPANNKAPLLEGGNYTKIGGMGYLKHEIISPKFYELLIEA